jgi:hypothetical protein
MFSPITPTLTATETQRRKQKQPIPLPGPISNPKAFKLLSLLVSRRQCASCSPRACFESFDHLPSRSATPQCAEDYQSSTVGGGPEQEGVNELVLEKSDIKFIGRVDE